MGANNSLIKIVWMSQFNPIIRPHDSKLNGSQPTDTQHNDIKHTDTGSLLSDMFLMLYWVF